MAYREEIRLDLLLMDAKNPRLPEVQRSQRDAIRTMARTLGNKLVALAEHIVSKGISLGDLPIVMEAEDDPDSYTVLDGNRRLAAIRSLEHPELVQGVLTPGQMNKLKKLAVEYQRKGPLESLLCVVVADRKEADPWIQLRHRGQGGGAGLAPWNGIQGARYDDRVGQLLPELEVFNFVRDQGSLPEDVLAKLDKFPISTLQRLVKDPNVRNRIGLELTGGSISTRYPAEEIIKPLRKMMIDLARGTVTVTDLKRKEHRIAYAAEFSSEDLPSTKKLQPLRPLAELPPITPEKEKGKGGRSKGKDKRDQRDTLVPSSLHLKIPIHRIADVFDELKRLNAETFKNIAGVMLRVFFEWTTEHYIDREGLRAGLSPDQKRSLHKRVIVMLDHLESSGKMTKAELKPIRVEVNNEHSLMAMDTLHAYVHNLKFQPKASELRETWNRMELLMLKIWS